MVPFWGTLNIRGHIIIGIHKGTMILTTTHIMSSPGGEAHGDELPAAKPHGLKPASGCCKASQKRGTVLGFRV